MTIRYDEDATATMIEAGARVIKESPGLDPGSLAEKVWVAMALAKRTPGPSLARK
jgi:hypothetical protein